jgi:hypothetical protein
MKTPSEIRALSLPEREKCYHHRFGGGQPCTADAVGPRIMIAGNSTDGFVWCADHGGVPAQEDNDSEVIG